MKKIFIIPILFLLFNTVEAQKKKSNQPVIKYQEFDYLQDTNVVYKNREALHSRVGIKITNINKKLVDINKDIQKSSFNEEVPGLFETFSKTSAPAASSGAAALALADLILLSSADIAAANVHDSVKRKLSNLQILYSNTGREMIRMQNLLKSYGADYTNVKSVLQYQSDLALLQYACKRSFSDILKDVNTLTLTTFSNISMGIAQADRALLLTSSQYVQNKGIINRYITKITGDAELHYNDINASFLPSNMDKLSVNVQKINTTLAELEKVLKRTVRPNANVTTMLGIITEELINFKAGRELMILNIIITNSILQNFKRILKLLLPPARQISLLFMIILMKVILPSM
ncbi:MAG: hypothetical protein IPL50_09845 [Chitinophagaceae bacterium]|nr:hypothetical protein [Chitinophagaceae bacterium]